MTFPPLKQLVVFIAVADHLSFSKAGDHLHVTHSAVSQAIKQLEQFLGHSLFDRQAGRVALTVAGKQFYEPVKSALYAISRATEEQLGRGAGNQLTVNVMTPLALRWLIPRIADFHLQYPDIDLRIATSGARIECLSEDVDMMIAYGLEQEWGEYESIKLFDDALVLVAASGMIAKGLSLSDIFKQYRSIYVEHDVRKGDWPAWCKSMAIREPRKSNRVFFQVSTQALQAVTAGVGVMVTHDPLIIDDLASGRLQKLSDHRVPMAQAYYLVYPKGYMKQARVQQFTQWLMAQL